MSPPRPRRTGSLRGEGRRQRQTSAQERSASAMDYRSPTPDARDEFIITFPDPVADVAPRVDTVSPEPQTLLARASSSRSRSSIAKPPIQYTSSGPSEYDHIPEDQAVRSIFPQYNPEVPLDRQDYYPTQASPTHIPRGAISRPLYSPSHHEPMASPLKSPLRSAGLGRWPNRTQETPVVPPVSSEEDLRGLWKVTNGWKASASEGQTYCLKMAAEPDAPVYTLSSETQPFYSMRLDPTSTSAYVSVFRHDPAKPYKGLPPPNTSVLASGGAAGAKSAVKDWQEVLSTALEEESRKQPPHDGLVALLYPTAAAKMALARPDDHATVALAEHECARLVWDADSGSHFLVHPALAMPFCVTVERNPAWSRTEYTLEHIESPQHLARLTRDGTGLGWLEFDTGIAAKIDSVYLADVAIAALLLVAHADDKFAKLEVFEPPPVLGSGSPRGSLLDRAAGGGSTRASLSSRMSNRRDSQRDASPRRKEKEKRIPKRTRMEQFEIDVESQTSEIAKVPMKETDGTEGLPGPVRLLIKLLTWTIKCLIWFIKIGFKALGGIIKCCLPSSEKL